MELDSAYAFLEQRLAAALPGVMVHEEEAPEEETYPFVVISLQTAEDVQGVNLSRCMVACQALVRVIGKGNDMTGLSAMADAVDAALHGASGVMDGREVVVIREQPYRSSGWVNGVLYKNLGGFYRIEIGA